MKRMLISCPEKPLSRAQLQYDNKISQIWHCNNIVWVAFAGVLLISILWKLPVAFWDTVCLSSCWHTHTLGPNLSWKKISNFAHLQCFGTAGKYKWKGLSKSNGKWSGGGLCDKDDWCGSRVNTRRRIWQGGGQSKCFATLDTISTYHNIDWTLDTISLYISLDTIS